MKKICLLLLLLLAAGFSLSAQDAGYPDIINNGTIFLNAGIGFGYKLEDGADMKIPPLLVSADFAIPIALQPFTVGIMAVYAAEKGTFGSAPASFGFSSHIIGAAFRLGYHLGWGIKPLDTYVHFFVGDIMSLTSLSYKNSSFSSRDTSNEFDNTSWIGIGIGGRYFFHPNVGAYIEANIAKLYNFGLGVSFRI